jgi:Flp pilus assembly protein TadG
MGQVGTTFALLAVPLLSLSGIAVDYTRALKT